MDPSLPPPAQPTLVYQFPFPKTKKIVLPKIFRTEDPTAKDNLAKTSAARDDVLNALETGSSNAITKVFPSLSFSSPKGAGKILPISFWSCGFRRRQLQHSIEQSFE